MNTPSKLTMALLVTAITIFALVGCTGSTGVQRPIGQQGPVEPVGASGVSITGASVNEAEPLVSKMILEYFAEVNKGSL